MADTTTKPEEKAAAVKLEAGKEFKLPTIVLAADADPSGKSAWVACFDGTVSEVNLESGERKQLCKHGSYASGVRLLKESNQVVSAGYDGVVQWAERSTQKQVRKVKAHKFWSWQMDVSPNEKWVASCSGQYLAGGYKYEPAPEQEPSVKVFDAQSGAVRWELSHAPPVLSLAFSPDSRHLAAANMMGDVKVWDLSNGTLINSFQTPDFTSWGIIKSHHYIGGIYDLGFTQDGTELVACGMGPMRDPMAGNGQQKWQKFAWKEDPAKRTGQINDDDRGNGLMESLAFHPSKPWFIMAGRLAQGKWNTALFDRAGKLLHSLDSKMRVTDTVFYGTDKVLLAGGTSQEKKKDGKYPEFGRLKLYTINPNAA